MAGRSRSRERRGDRKKEKGSSRRHRSDDSASSRERERRRRKAQVNYLQKGQKKNADANMFWDGFQWIPKISSATTQEHNATRKNRRVYVANLPMHLGLSEELLGQQIFAAMRERNLIPPDSPNPVLHVWFAREKGGNYGFVEFGTLEETEKGLMLDGMTVMGTAITVKRPSDYQLPLVPGMMPMPGALPAPAIGPEVRATSRIVRLVGVLHVDENTENDDFLDVIDDMTEEGKKCGDLKSVMMTRAEIEDPATGAPMVGAGDAFLEYGDLEAAEACFGKWRGRKYDNRPVVLASIDEEQWQIILPILQEMNSADDI